MPSLPIDAIAYWSLVAITCFPAIGFLACALAGLRKENQPGGRGEMVVSQAVKAAGFEILDNFMLVTDSGEISQIDHAVRMPGGILVVETKDWKGSFTYPADAWSGSWTDHGGDEPVPAFDGANPFGQNEMHCDAVREVVGKGIPVWNVVVMSHPSCGISADHVEEGERPEIFDRLYHAGQSILLPWDDWPVVWELDDLNTRLRSLAERRAEGVAEAWEALKGAAKRDSKTRRLHADQVGAEPDVERRQSLVTLCLFGIVSAAASAAFWAFQWGYIG